MRDPSETALAFDRACASASVPYALLGGMAVMAWGQPRFTSDVDAMVVLDRAGAPALVEALERQGLRVDPRDFTDALQDRGHVTAFDDRTGFHVDVKLAFTAEERTQVLEAVRVPFGGGALSISRPEETVAFKLRFGTPQDLADARSILVRQEGHLDLARLRAFAARLGVTAPLDHVLREIASRK